MKMHVQHTQFLRYFESSTNRKILSNKYLHKEPEKISHYNLNSTLESCRIKRANSHKRRRWQGIIKLRTEINKIETKKTIQIVNETESWFFEKNQQDRQTLIQTNQKAKREQINKIRNERGT